MEHHLLQISRRWPVVIATSLRLALSNEENI